MLHFSSEYIDSTAQGWNSQRTSLAEKPVCLFDANPLCFNTEVAGNGPITMNIGIIYNSFANKALLPERKRNARHTLQLASISPRLGTPSFILIWTTQKASKNYARASSTLHSTPVERIHDNAHGEAYVAALLEFS